MAQEEYKLAYADQSSRERSIPIFALRQAQDPKRSRGAHHPERVEKFISENGTKAPLSKIKEKRTISFEQHFCGSSSVVER